MMEFVLTPHVKKILCGRRMCKDDRLLCAATNCLFHPKESPDSDYGRDIRVKGYADCPRCGTRNDYADARWDDHVRAYIMECIACKKTIPARFIVWTQVVVSRHRRNKHEYFHKECWDAMFIDLPDEASFCGYFESDKEIVRLIKWALKA